MKTVTIGIPAYNEEANIGNLLEGLLKLTRNDFRLKKIIIASDGSTDNTVPIIRSIKAKNIQIVDNKIRKGTAIMLNQIISKSDSDILVIVNADIVIYDSLFISKIINPILNNKADLVSVPIIEISSNNVLSKALKLSMELKSKVFDFYRKGDNVYTCHGPARAFSKKLYQKITFKTSIGEDAYSYLFCKVNHFKYQYVKSTAVYYKLPDNFKDHRNQSIRFINSKSLMKQYFGEEFVANNYLIPKKILFKITLKYFLTNPVGLIYYLLILLVSHLMSIFAKNTINTWIISNSSKVLE